MILWIGTLFGTLLAFISGILYFFRLKSFNAGRGKTVEIANTIREASFTYLQKQYIVICCISLILSLLIMKIFGFIPSLFFISGVIASTVAGFFNMYVSLVANIRTVEAAKHNLASAFKVSIFSGVTASIVLHSCGLFVILLCVYIGDKCNVLNTGLICLGAGASLVSVFARLGGGIFTKGADVGADMVGKVEVSLPEDDCRNPAVIADNVGDNVGDCAGMSADLMESYVVSICAALLVTNLHTPLIICLSGLFACIIPVIFMRFDDAWKAMNRYFFSSAILFVAFMAVAVRFFKFITIKECVCLTIGVIVVSIILRITEYYTSTEYSPVKSVAKASTFGHGTNVIYGLAIAHESVVAPIITVIIGILSCYLISGLDGITYGILGIIALSPAVLVLDIFGPVTDNAGGIAEMSGLPNSVRTITDHLDAIGNTTKALTKGFAISSAIFTAVIMLHLFHADLQKIKYISLLHNLGGPQIICGLLYGALVPCLFTGLSLKSVSEAASAVVQEVRGQLKENPGIIDGSVKPNYNNTVSLLTSFSIRSMVIPSLLPVIFPVSAFIAGFYLNRLQGAFLLLNMTLLGITIFGGILSIIMIMAGGLWDNAKKYIETGYYGGKGTEAHKAAVTGDTVGDPYKDTAGPSLNSVIKLSNLVGILIIYM